LDWQVPLWRITQWSGGAITGSTPVQLFFGTSQSANLAVLNKDFMIGNSVTFGPTSTVTLVPQAAPGPGPGGGGPIVGPPIVTEIPDTHMPPVAQEPVWLLAVPLVLSALVAVSRPRPVRSRQRA
jgi:hypothetical protein